MTDFFSTRTVRPSTRPASASQGRRDRALVLGGGGAAGNAWLVGVVGGLLDAGVDVSAADLLVGTSAGATAAAMISSSDSAALYAAVLAEEHRAPAPAPGRAVTASAQDVMRVSAEIIATSSDPADMRRRLGAAAIEAAAPDPSRQESWRATVASRLPSPDWPAQRMLAVAVDAGTGEPVVFDRESGVELVDAIAASCSVQIAYRIGDAHYVDGGYRRSSENADLVAGSDRVVVLSPLGGRTRTPQEWGTALAVQVDELRAGGSGVVTVLPDDASVAAFGTSMMDLTARPASARAGFAQGRRSAAEVAAVWG